MFFRSTILFTILLFAASLFSQPCFSTMEPGSLGLCAEFTYPSEGIYSSCADQGITARIACCDTTLGIADTIHITSSDSTTEWYDSTSGTWEPVVRLDPSPWGDYWVHLSTDTCDFVWSTYPASSYTGDWFRVLVESECTEIDSAFIRIQVDNQGTLYANGTYIDTTHGNPGSGSTGWRMLHEFDLTEYFHGGVDTVSIMGFNSGGIAGMIFEIYVYCKGGCCGNIDPATIAMEVAGSVYHTDDPELTWDGDSLLSFTPMPPDTFTDGQLVEARILYAEDSCGWGFDSALFSVDLSFNIDLSPPIYELLSPLDIVLNEMPPGFTFDIFDSLTGVDPLSVTYNTGTGELTAGALWDGSVLTVPSDSIDWSPGDSIHITISAWDRPDLCDPNASSASFSWYMRDPESPTAEFIYPEPMVYTACAEESIVVIIEDPFGIDSTTIELIVNGTSYTLPTPQLHWEEPRLTFTDPTGFTGNDTIMAELIHAQDNFGNDIDASISITFLTDHTPPYSEFTQPDQPMVRDTEQDIAFSAGDGHSGLDLGLCYMIVNGIEYSSDHLQIDGETFRFIPEEHGISFINGDTVSACLHLFDSPDHCSPNESEICHSFTIEPVITCGIAPNPFTPNGDGINDSAIFYYPDLFSETVEITVFDKRRVKVWKSTANPQHIIGEAQGRLWNGMDNQGRQLNPGLYLYTVSSGGEVICNGTIVLVR